MKRLASIWAAAALLGALTPSGASAAFGLHDLEVAFTASDGSASLQAGSHPFAMTTSFALNTVDEEGAFVDGAIKDLEVFQPAGLVADRAAVPHCSALDFLTKDSDGVGPSCPDSSAIGLATITLGGGGGSEEGGPFAVYLLEPPFGAVAKLGFWATNEVPVSVNVSLSPTPPYNGVASSRNTLQILEVVGVRLTLWGNPADPAHDPLRGNCLREITSPSENPSIDECPAKVSPRPFLTLPRSCTGPLKTIFKATGWWEGDPQNPSPAIPFEGVAQTDDGSEPPNGATGCSKLSFDPELSAQPTTASAASPSGLEVSLAIEDEGLTSSNEGATAKSDIKSTRVTLPRGMTINASQAEGLAVCSEADLGREDVDSEFGDGCPASSRIGAIEVETPLLEGKIVKGSLFVAEPYHNLADDSLIALYVVIADRELGILVKQPIKVEPDPQTGQLVSSVEDMPQLPFSSVRLRLREGARSPLITPPGCDADPSTPGRDPHKTEVVFTPWANPSSSYVGSSEFSITSGVNGGPCPSGPAPFEPGFSAGTLNNAAGSYSPFLMRLARKDGEQDMSKFSAVLPPGVVGRIAGVPWCPEAGIARARSRTGDEGGKEELADPSCPAASQIGRTTAGAGVGPQLTYVPGSLYLAGPYNGSPLSVVSITPAVAGPFDAGTVVVRVALDLNPKTGVAEADGAASDPIPHILQGIPLNVRDLRVHVDRPGFTLNATSCAPSATFATLWGAGTALAPQAEVPVGLSARYQAASCASLGFKPRLGLKLRGATRRGGFPSLRAVYTPKPGDANLKRLGLLFPSSAFIEQGHFRTICTRVRFAAGAGHGSQCPKGSIYGRARVWTPLLEEPLQGPVYLRSSDNDLPDAVFALSGIIEIEVVVAIDSARGRLRAIVQSAPDAPVSKAIVDMQGGQKGLFVNSRNLCFKPKRNRARANLKGQNGRLSRNRPRTVAVKCQKRRKAKRARRAARSSANGFEERSRR